MNSALIGIDEVNVSAWMSEHVGAVPPLAFELIAGGRSNLTYRVTDATGKSFALRRPPTSHVLPTAHDMVREHTIIAALYPLGIPVAQPLGLCVDEEVNERPFYVMEFVDGAVLRDRTGAESTFDESIRGVIGSNLASTLSQLHDVDIDAAGLSELARHDGYIERQLRRWRTQYDQMHVEGVDYGGIVEAVGDELNSRIPVQQRVSVVHGDYRLDNTVLDEHGAVRAILDWEICTLGDPVADLGLLLVYWAEPSDPTANVLGVSPTTASGFESRDQVLRAYASHSALDLSHVAYYQAFGYWKLACIMQGVYARYSAGAAGGDQGSVAEYPMYIAMLAESAKMTLEKELMDDEIYDHIIFLADPELNEPVLVIALEGWIDAGLGASNAIGTLLDTIYTEVLATFDTEYFIDQRARRPIARIVDGVTTELTWPEIQLRFGRDGDGADILFLVGPEPDFHWSDFVDVVTDAAGRFDVRLVVGLGAFPAPTPHTRPVRIIGTAPATSANLLTRVGTVSGELEVPAGINSALELGFSEVDMEIVTLWARVPHYVASMPYPQASAALIDGLASIAGLTLDASALRVSADEARQRVDDLVTNNPDHTSMVEQLEAAADEVEGASISEELPSGDELAAELEKFLRGETT